MWEDEEFLWGRGGRSASAFNGKRGRVMTEVRASDSDAAVETNERTQRSAALAQPARLLKKWYFLQS